MSYPPQQPWGQGGHGGQPPQQWGGQPQQPQWGGHQGSQWQGQPGQSWGGQGGQQWQGQQPPQGQQWGGQQGQQWAGQQGQQWAGQGGPQWQGQQYPGGPAPSGGGKGKVWLIVGAGVLVVAVIAVVVFLMFGGGDYAGDERPPLPDSFDGWTKSDSMLGTGYTKGGDTITVLESDDTDDAPTPSIDPGQVPEADDDTDHEDSKPAKGVECRTLTNPEREITGCRIKYKDGLEFLVLDLDVLGGSTSRETVEEAAVALSKE
ncbi:hypothetical protein [uncultured Tessaracoccus sp.]|uniref:hypothetical protein n=1 Tax=uncultured Tessaracoccus sp. TaxID=905023 RepID=UPI0025D1E25F|nr:hypothetical protein [uncultured Tessaracoccus sp.]